MRVIKGSLYLIYFIVVPILLGIGFFRKDEKEKNNILLAYVWGYLIQFAVFQFITVPMIYLHSRFTTLLYIWIGIIGGLSIVGLFFNRKRLKEIFCDSIQKIKEIPVIAIGAIVLIVIQLYVPFRYMYQNNDDARFVGIATTAIETNTLMQYDALTGKPYANVAPTRRTLAPFSLYIAVTSKLIFSEPAIVAHTIFPVVFISFGYAVYFLIAKKMLRLNREEIFIFLIFFSIINIFGFFSRFTPSAYFLRRIWQGKAMVAGIYIPLAYLLLDTAIKSGRKLDWFAIVLLSLSAAMASTIGNIMIPLALELLTTVFAIKDRKISYFLKTTICCIPNIIYSLIYLIV